MSSSSRLDLYLEHIVRRRRAQLWARIKAEYDIPLPLELKVVRLIMRYERELGSVPSGTGPGPGTESVK